MHGGGKMRNQISLALVVPLVALAVSCSANGDGDAGFADRATAGGGTVAPAIIIESITFLVDGARLTLSKGDLLPATPGSQVRVVEVKISVGDFLADGGEACVDFAPARDSGEEVFAEHTGTHMVPLTPGLITVPGPDRSWTIDETWVGIMAVVNHWPGARTQDQECAEGLCERDQQFLLRFRPSATT